MFVDLGFQGLEQPEPVRLDALVRVQGARNLVQVAPDRGQLRIRYGKCREFDFTELRCRGELCPDHRHDPAVHREAGRVGKVAQRLVLAPGEADLEAPVRRVGVDQTHGGGHRRYYRERVQGAADQQSNGLARAHTRAPAMRLPLRFEHAEFNGHAHAVSTPIIHVL
jgi:hypothetical protein